jgi:hypothetical protein
MNDESLERVNRFLAAVAARTELGGLLPVTPAEIGRELGFPDALSTARAVRALIARRRLEPAQGTYRLLDARQVEPGEKEVVGRRPRRPRAVGSTRAGSAPGSRAYSDFGRAAIDRLVELGRENAELRASVRSLREESRDLREGRDEADRRARSLSERVRELESRAEMAESNLRTLLATAKGREPVRDAPVGDSEMAAILGVLRGEEEVDDTPEPA